MIFATIFLSRNAFYNANTFVFKKKLVTATAKEFLTPLSGIKKEGGGLGIF